MKLYPFLGFKITATWKALQKSRIVSISFDFNVVQPLNITGYYKKSTCNFIYFRFSRWIVQKTDQLQLNPLTKKDKRKQEKERERGGLNFVKMLTLGSRDRSGYLERSILVNFKWTSIRIFQRPQRDDEALVDIVVNNVQIARKIWQPFIGKKGRYIGQSSRFNSSENRAALV